MKTWPTKKLSEICDFQNGLWKGKKPPLKKVKVLRNTNFRNGGFLDLGSVAEIEAEKKQLAERLLQKGDLILERSGGGPTQPVGRVVYFEVDGEFSFSNFTTRIRARNPEELYDKYLWRYLNQLYISGVTETMQKQTTGIRNLNFAEYKNLDIPLPPIEEQKRIVEKIEKLFAKIGEASRLRAESSTASATLLPSISKNLFNKWRDNGWKEYLFSDICTATQGVQIAKLYHETQPRVGYRRYLYISDFYSDARIKYVEDKYPTKVVKAGDIIVANTGSPGMVFRGIDGVLSNNLFKVGFDKSRLLGEYLFLFLSSSYFQDILQTQMKKMTQPHLGHKTMARQKIIVPPIAEQKKIVAYLDSLSQKARELQNLQSQTAADFSALRQSVLAKSFQHS